MTTNSLVSTKKELSKLQKRLNVEMNKGKYKDTKKIQSIKKEIKSKKLEIGNITKGMISQIVVEK